MWGGTKEAIWGAGTYAWDGVCGFGRCAYGVGELGYAGLQSAYFQDGTYLKNRWSQTRETLSNFGKAVWNDPLGAMVPGVMEAWRNPTSPEAWGKAAVDIGLLGFSAAKIGSATKLSRFGRLGEELTAFGKTGSIASKTLKLESIVSQSTTLKPLGLGSTGRITALNLTEQLAMKEIISNPRLGKVVMPHLHDSRWAGWSKMQHTKILSDGKRVNVHYVARWENGVLKAVDDFKFK